MGKCVSWHHKRHTGKGRICRKQFKNQWKSRQRCQYKILKQQSFSIRSHLQTLLPQGPKYTTGSSGLCYHSPDTKSCPSEKQAHQFMLHQCKQLQWMPLCWISQFSLGSATCPHAGAPSLQGTCSTPPGTAFGDNCCLSAFCRMLPRAWKSCELFQVLSLPEEKPNHF